MLKVLAKVMLATLLYGSLAAAQGERPGRTGEFGKLYTLGTNPPLQIMLKSADYTVAQVAIGEVLFSPARDEKLLVLHLSAQNPTAAEIGLDGGSLGFTVVDARNLNHEGCGIFGSERNRDAVALSLKPKQKEEFYTVIAVPATGVMPKLMVQANDHDPILRYDLRGKVTALKPPFVAADDRTGVDAVEEIPGALGRWLPASIFDLRVDAAGPVAIQIPDYDLPEDHALFGVTLTIKSAAPVAVSLDGGAIDASLLLSDDQTRASLVGSLWQDKTTRNVELELKPKQEVRARFIFAVPKDLTPKRLSLFTCGNALVGGDSRVLAYELPQAAPPAG